MSDLKIFTDNIEPSALEQIYRLVEQPAFSDCKVRIMPDVHAGAGCVIGFTADLGDKVIPNVVGVDIGCGMFTVNIGKVDIDFKKLDEVIREKIPSGMAVRERNPFNYPLDNLCCYKHLKNKDWIINSIGTLGGGNHFIEVDADEEGNKYLVVHTGSRNLGKQVAEYYQSVAIENLHGRGARKAEIDKLIEEYKAAGRQKDIPGGIAEIKKNFGGSVPKELCYLEGRNREEYLNDMRICQNFASLNRAAIIGTILGCMGWALVEAFETIHNYIDHESNIVRKGAISARKGEKVLIPLNMRDGCIVGVGKGNEDWNCSAPHGAGRVMSRKKAKESVSMQEYVDSMSGIYTTSVNDETIDESPMAYKSAEEIISRIGETVEIQKVIKPLYNFKASE